MLQVSPGVAVKPMKSEAWFAIFTNHDSDYAVDATAFYEAYGEEARIEAERLIFEAEED